MSNGIATGLYEESEGLTSDDLRAYLRRMGWRFENSRWWLNLEAISLGESGPVISDSTVQSMPEYAMRILLAVEGRSMQAILRDLNPRMRKGCPSKEARAAHAGHWLAMFPRNEGMNLWRRDLMDHFAETSDLSEWSFWPATATADKVPWPTDREGKPL